MIYNDIPPPNAIGFIYKITNLSNGKFYIGKKQLFSQRKKNLTKKELPTDKRLKTYKIEKLESNWREYNGSCIPLLEDISRGDIYKKEILEWCYTKRDLSYLEVKYQFQYNVLEDILSYNTNINGSWYKKKG